MKAGRHPQLDRSTIEELEATLLHARQDLVRNRRGSEDELDSIEAVREIEWAELAQEEHTADVRTRLTAQQFARLRQIDGALERVAQGAFGLCMDCGEPIAVERLRAQPWGASCAGCTQQREAQPPPASGDFDDRPQDHRQDVPDPFGDQRLAGAPLPPELSALDDAEVAATIREAFRTEVGDALEDVRVLCRDGVVILVGEVANDSLPEIARRIVEDEVGYEVVDRLMVTGFAGGPEPERPHFERPYQLPAETLDINDEDIENETSENILEVEEEGLTFVPPTRPVPER